MKTFLFGLFLFFGCIAFGQNLTSNFENGSNLNAVKTFKKEAKTTKVKTSKKKFYSSIKRVSNFIKDEERLNKK